MWCVCSLKRDSVKLAVTIFYKGVWNLLYLKCETSWWRCWVLVMIFRSLFLCLNTKRIHRGFISCSITVASGFSVAFNFKMSGCLLFSNWSVVYWRKIPCKNVCALSFSCSVMLQPQTSQHGTLLGSCAIDQYKVAHSCRKSYIVFQNISLIKIRKAWWVFNSLYWLIAFLVSHQSCGYLQFLTMDLLGL